MSGRREPEDGTEPTAAVSRSAVLTCRGPMRLMLDDGRDVTPQSAMRQAILAVLAYSPGQIRARKFLQDMFWGEAAVSERAASNLRSALHLLKKDLAVFGGEVLHADRHTVSLVPSRIRLAETESEDAEFLEGLDLDLADCEVFEDWLRQMRSLSNSSEEDLLVRPRVSAGQPVIRHLALGLLAPLHAGVSQAAAFRVEGLVDAIARFLAQTTFLDVHDMRSCARSAVPLPLQSGRGPTHWLQPIVERTTKSSVFRLRLMDAATRRLIWLSEPVALDAMIAGFDDDVVAVPLAEMVVHKICLDPPSAASPDLFPLTALVALFSLDDRIISTTEAKLKTIIQSGSHPVMECLYLFTQVFKTHECWGEIGAGIDGGVLRARISALPVSDPLLPLCQSLLGYSAHMLTSENDLGAFLVEEAFERAPKLALNLDHLAVLRLARGDLTGAEEAFSHCIGIGAGSPWRYTYEVTGSMIHLARGDWRKSLYFANQALFRQPRYLGALRYAMAGLALSDKPQDAHRMLNRIQQLRPDFDLSAWAEGVLHRMPLDLGKMMVTGLQRGSLL